MDFTLRKDATTQPPHYIVIFKAKDYIGLFAVDVDENCGDICKLAAKLFHHLVGVGQFGPGADQANHDLAAVGAAPQEDVADQAFAGFFVVGLDAVLFQQAAQGAADFIEDRRLQFAVLTGNDAVTAPGIKADAQMTIFVAAYRILYLVAVTVHFGRGENGLDGDIQPANPAERIRYRVLLGIELGLIAQVPQAAPAAGPCHRAVHRDAVRGSCFDALHNAEGVPLAVFDNSSADDIAGRSTRHENRFALPMADAAAVAGQPFDGQGDDLIFL